MLIAVYRTKKKEGTYLYVPKKGDFSALPEALLSQFGTPELVMLIPIEKRAVVAGVEKEKLIRAMEDPGFYLQMPPKEENLLDTHRSELGLTLTHSRL